MGQGPRFMASFCGLYWPCAACRLAFLPVCHMDVPMDLAYAFLAYFTPFIFFKKFLPFSHNFGSGPLPPFLGGVLDYRLERQMIGGNRGEVKIAL